MVCDLGKPYNWAQWLAGLDFLPVTNSTSGAPTPQQSYVDLSRQHSEKTFRLIVDRLSSRLALCHQLSDLAEGKVLIGEVNRFPKKISAVLQKFAKITAEDAMVSLFYIFFFFSLLVFILFIQNRE